MTCAATAPTVTAGPSRSVTCSPRWLVLRPGLLPGRRVPAERRVGAERRGARPRAGHRGRPATGRPTGGLARRAFTSFFTVFLTSPVAFGGRRAGDRRRHARHRQRYRRADRGSTRDTVAVRLAARQLVGECPDRRDLAERGVRVVHAGYLAGDAAAAQHRDRARRRRPSWRTGPATRVAALACANCPASASSTWLAGSLAPSAGRGLRGDDDGEGGAVPRGAAGGQEAGLGVGPQQGLRLGDGQPELAVGLVQDRGGDQLRGLLLVDGLLVGGGRERGAVRRRELRC